MKLFDLVKSHTWDDIRMAFVLYERASVKELIRYQEAYSKLKALQPVPSELSLFLDEKKDLQTGESWYLVLGKNGKRWKDRLSPIEIRNVGEEYAEREQEYALSYVDWEELLGMEITPTTLEKFPEDLIIQQCLEMMTFFWYSAEEYQSISEEIEAIKQGHPLEITFSHEGQFKNYYQVWSSLENGSEYGLLTTYWGIGPNQIQMQGIMIRGLKEGLWTHWNRHGEISKQGRFICDRAVKVKKEPPWWQE